jgi:hypothetical protein
MIIEETPKSGPHLDRPSYYNWMIHQQDSLKNQGFDYENRLMGKIISKYMLVDPRKEYTFLRFQTLLVYLIDAVGSIKKAFNYTVPKNHRMRT